MLTKVKERVKAWKRFYTQGCKNIDENSSWHEILMELEYYPYTTVVYQVLILVLMEC